MEITEIGDHLAYLPTQEVMHPMRCTTLEWPYLFPRGHPIPALSDSKHTQLWSSPPTPVSFFILKRGINREGKLVDHCLVGWSALLYFKKKFDKESLDLDQQSSDLLGDANLSISLKID